MVFLYTGFSVTLASWTLISGWREEVYIVWYFLTVGILTILGLAVLSFAKNKKNLYCSVLVGLILTHIGASVAFRMDLSGAGAEVMFSKDFFIDTLCEITIFFITYGVIRYTQIYRLKTVNMLIILLLPLVLFFTRIRGEVTGGAYIISCVGILIFALVLAGYPFVAAYFLTRPEQKYLRGTVRSMPLNLTCFLVYNLILYTLSAVCNEFGLVLVLGITSTIIFYDQCKNFRTKLIYTFVCTFGAVLAATFTHHIQERVFIWLHLEDIMPDDDLAGKAESILYLFQNLPRTGFWGNGLGSVPTSLIPTLNTDHIFVALILEYSVIFAAIVLCCGVLLSKSMLMGCQPENLYDYYLNLTAGLLVSATGLIHVGSNLGSFVTAGLSFPFLSTGTSTNNMFALLLAISVAIHERRGSKNALSERQKR